MKLILSLFVLFTILCPASGCTTREVPQSENTLYEEMTDVGNTRNYGYVIKDGTGGICVRSNDVNGNLTGIRREKNGVTSDIATEGIGPLFFCHEGWIYYKDADTQKLNRINYDTKQIEIVLDEICVEAVIKDEMLYCILLPERGLYEFSLLGNQSRENGNVILGAGARNLLLYDDNIYFIKDSTLFKGTDDQEAVVSGLKTDLLYILDGNFFYIDAIDGFLYKKSLSGTTDVVSEEYCPEFMNVLDGKLIFVAMDNTSVMRTYTYDPSKMSIKQYSKYGYGNICIGNGKVYECAITDAGIEIRCL